jgi:hypothetical protein
MSRRNIGQGRIRVRREASNWRVAAMVVTSLVAGGVVGFALHDASPASADKVAGCVALPVPTGHVEYVGADEGDYGEWLTVDPVDGETTRWYGFAAEEDSLIYDSLRCVYTAPSYAG